MELLQPGGVLPSAPGFADARRKSTAGLASHAGLGGQIGRTHPARCATHATVITATGGCRGDEPDQALAEARDLTAKSAGYLSAVE